MNNRSNKYISDALRIADDLMGPAGNESGVTDEAGFVIIFGLIRDCAYKVRHQAELEGRIAKKDRKHTNAILAIFAAAALSIFFAPPVSATSIILSTDATETLGGLSFTDGGLAEYNPTMDTAALYFDENLFGGNENINAAHVLANGNIILSTEAGATLGGLNFSESDLAEYNPTTDTATLFFDENLFTGFSQNIDAVYVHDNGNIILSTEYATTLGGLSFGDGDLVEYNPTTDTATLFFDGSLFDGSENIDAAHILDNGNIILSTAASCDIRRAHLYRWRPCRVQSDNRYCDFIL